MKGKISAGIFRVMAVVSALAIGGGYVAWRQTEAEKANKRERMDQAQAEDELELMVGSKNPGRPIIGKEMTKEEIDAYLEKDRDFIEPIPGIPEGAREVSNVIPLLPGSKSISMPLFTKDDITNEGGLLPPIEELDEEEAAKPDTKQKRPTLLPSSKVGIFIPAEILPEKSK